jgi:hypothetical protein
MTVTRYNVIFYIYRLLKSKKATISIGTTEEMTWITALAKFNKKNINNHQLSDALIHIKNCHWLNQMKKISIDL